MKKFLEVGRVLKLHGIYGAVKLEHWCDGCFVFKQFKFLYLDSEGKVKIQVESSSFFKNFVIIKFVDINKTEEANKLVGKILFADRKSFSLPDGRCFVQDLIGCSLVDSSNVDMHYGVVEEVLNYGASDIYKIRNESGHEFLVPAIDEVVCEKDLKKGLIFIKPMRGLFDV